MEEFCTHFDSAFVPAGLALYESLERHCSDFHLTIICLDEACRETLRELQLVHATLVPLAEIESEELLRVKAERTRTEYCWTLTPFVPEAAFRCRPDATRMTYLDADLFFFDDPTVLLAEMGEAERSVYITEHAYAPEYDLTATCGRFCVQFLCFSRTDPALQVLHDWQRDCVEWCYDRIEDGKCGDQKYLDLWPDAYPEVVHVCQQQARTRGPWNTRMFSSRSRGSLVPVFYHFQGLRIIAPDMVRLYSGYRIDNESRRLYDTYLASLDHQIGRLHAIGRETPTLPVQNPRLFLLRRFIWTRIRRTVAYAKLKPRGSRDDT